MRQIALDAESNRLVLTFPYHPTVVEIVRGLPERRWDPSSKTWSVPREHVVEVMTTLGEHGFQASEAVATLLAEAGGPGDAGGLPAGDAGNGAAAARDDGPPTLRISEINQRVRRAITQALPSRFWVVGEIAGLDRNRHKKNVYFELVEKAEGADHPRAKVTAVLFERNRIRLRRKVEMSPEPFELHDGIEVRFQVRADLYEPTGSYQLIVEDVDPVYTLGRLAATRLEILRALDQRGLRERNRARPLPAAPLRVGLITSWESDAFNDVRKELEQSGYAFRLDVFDARMQGRELRATVLGGLRHFQRLADDFDVLVIARGGGSRSDLAWFDDLEIAVAVAEHPLKIVCGIGHERDQSVIDQIAASVKTPTAAAQTLVGRVREIEEVVEQRGARIADLAARGLARENERLQQFGRRAGVAAERSLGAARIAVDHRAQLVARAGLGGVRTARNAVANRAERLQTATQVATRLANGRIDQAVRALDPVRTARLFARETARVTAIDARLRALDPKRVLERGYAAVRDRSGRLVTDVARLADDEAVAIQFRDGEADARITERRPAPGPGGTGSEQEHDQDAPESPDTAAAEENGTKERP